MVNKTCFPFDYKVQNFSYFPRQRTLYVRGTLGLQVEGNRLDFNYTHGLPFGALQWLFPDGISMEAISWHSLLISAAWRSSWQGFNASSPLNCNNFTCELVSPIYG